MPPSCPLAAYVDTDVLTLRALKVSARMGMGETLPDSFCQEYKPRSSKVVVIFTQICIGA